MPYIPVPKDLTKVKSKVLFNLTRRQLRASVLREKAPEPGRSAVKVKNRDKGAR